MKILKISKTKLLKTWKMFLISNKIYMTFGEEIHTVC